MLSLSLTHHLDLHLLLIFLIPFQRVLVGIMEVTYQAKEIKHLKAQIKKLKKKAKHGRKPAKAKPSVHKNTLFDELADDTLDYMDTENAQDAGRTRNVVYEEERSAEDAVSIEDAVSTEDVVSTDKEKLSTNRSKDSTDKEKDSTDKETDSTDRPDEGTEGRSATPTPTHTMFGDDETITQVLLNMSQAKAVSREKEKGVELKDVEKTKRPRPTSTRSLLTLKPLLKIDPKDKGKKKIEEEDESNTESEGIPEAEKKFKQLARDEEMARKVQEDWEAEEEVKKLAEEEVIKAALSNEYDFIQARIEADRLLALRLQDEERDSSLLWKREQNSFMIQLQLKEETLRLGSTEDERKIKEMNEGAKDLEQKRLKKVAKEILKKEDIVKVPAKVDVTEQGTIDNDIMEKKSFIVGNKSLQELILPRLKVDSLKVDLVVIQNTCSEKEDSNSETASSKLVKECSLNSETKDVHAIKYKMSKAKERCMAYFRSLHSQPSKSIRTDIKVQDDSTGQGNVLMPDDADIRPIYDEEPNDMSRVEPIPKTLFGLHVHRSDLKWKPTGRIFKSVGLRWIPTGKLFDSCTSKVDSEPPHGSNVDILNIHECKQTLNVSAGTSINVQKEQSLNLSAEVHQETETVTTSNELDLLFGPLFDEYFNGENQVVLKSSAVTTTDASNKHQQQPDSTSSTSTLATTVTADGNFDL
ncbi:hypothetical protein Tco_1493699 [Tanacetum coccineum]